MRWSLALGLAGAGRRGVSRCGSRGAFVQSATVWTAWHPTACAVPFSHRCSRSFQASAVTTSSGSFTQRPNANAKSGKSGGVGKKGTSHTGTGGGIRGFVEINKRIITSADADALLSVVATEWRGMNTVNVATAWHRLAKLAKINRSFKNKTKMTHDPRVQILERLALQFVEDFDCMNLTNVVWSLAVLEHGFGGPGGSQFLNRALERIVEAAKRGLSQKKGDYLVDSKNTPSAQSLSNLLWAFTTMRLTAHAGELADLIVEVTPFLMRGFDPGRGTHTQERESGAFVPQTISNQLWAFAVLKKHPGDLHFDLCGRLIAENVLNFKPQELTNIVWAFCVLNHFPGDEILVSFEVEIARRAVKGEFNAQNLSTLILALSSFPHDDPASRASLSLVMKALDTDKVLASVERFNFQDTANALFGAAQMGGFASFFFKKTWHHMCGFSNAAVQMETKEQLSGGLMIYNSFLLLSAVAPRVQLNLPAMPAWLLAGAAKRWSKQAENGTVSEFQRDVGNRLTGLGVAHATEVTTSDGNMSMDIFLPQLNISLECDGPSHFCVNANVGKVPLLRNATRAALLGARGVHAVSLPWDEWARAEDLGECDAMLADVVGRFRE